MRNIPQPDKCDVDTTKWIDVIVGITPFKTGQYPMIEYCPYCKKPARRPSDKCVKQQLHA